MKKLFVLFALASFAANLWFFAAPPHPVAPVAIETIDNEITAGTPGRFDCVVNHFARVKLSDGKVVRVRISGDALESIR